MRPKDAALLAVVALGGPIKVDHVAAMRWPEASAKQADVSWVRVVVPGRYQNKVIAAPRRCL